jgi:hypothetical protein
MRYFPVVGPLLFPVAFPVDFFSRFSIPEKMTWQKDLFRLMFRRFLKVKNMQRLAILLRSVKIKRKGIV